VVGQAITVYVTVDSDLQEENIIQINNVEKMASLDELLQECKSKFKIVTKHDRNIGFKTK